jgi:hypothetical protein
MQALASENPVGMANIVAVDFNPRLLIVLFFNEFRRDGTFKVPLNKCTVPTELIR